MALGTLWMIDLGLAAASIVVLALLLVIYRSNFRSLQSPLSFGLIVFAALFLLENLAAMYFYLSCNDSLSTSGYAGSVAMPMPILNTVATVALPTLTLLPSRVPCR